MRRKLLLNTTMSLFLQIATVVSGLILPRLFIIEYGSEVNGLIQSITQFLKVISYLELGVGAVVQSAFYHPLATGNIEEVSKIFSSASKFFRKIAFILVFYVAGLIVIYPNFLGESFDRGFVAFLIFIMSISMFTQYYFGMVNRLLLFADQKNYCFCMVQLVTLLLNTVVAVILIRLHFDIRIVKIATAMIYVARPVVLEIYVRMHYKINRKVTYFEEPIRQKWNGLAQHFAAIVLDNTDVLVLTIMSNLSNVSIYSVYNIVIIGIKDLVMSMTNGIQSLMGELWAKQERERLNQVFEWTEWIVHTGVVFLFGCMSVLILPFVRVYTLGVDDADYVVPLFALLITLAHGLHCLRLPYHIMIKAGGHYKQTQGCYILAMFMNLLISILAVGIWGLIGVAIGTLGAMVYQTIWMAWYNSKNLLQWSFRKFLKQCGVDMLSFISAYGLSTFVQFQTVSVRGWIIMAIEVSFLWMGMGIISNMIFYRQHMITLLDAFRHRIKN